MQEDDEYKTLVISTTRKNKQKKDQMGNIAGFSEEKHTISLTEPKAFWYYAATKNRKQKNGQQIRLKPRKKKNEVSKR